MSDFEESYESVAAAMSVRAKSRRSSRDEQRESERVETERKRVPIGSMRQKRAFKFKDPQNEKDYHLHMALDENVEGYLQHGYEYVRKDEIYANLGAVLTGQDAGDQVRMRDGTDPDTGRPIYSYLLKIRRELWEEDQEALRQEQADQEKRRNINVMTAQIAEGYIDPRTRIG